MLVPLICPLQVNGSRDVADFVTFYTYVCLSIFSRNATVTLTTFDSGHATLCSTKCVRFLVSYEGMKLVPAELTT